jgi:rhodanese-related sulfurtransferase
MPTGVREIPADALAAAHRDGAVVVDVREPHEYVAGGTEAWTSAGMPVVTGPRAC